ncbi:MAG: FHA domain-containing protein [Acidobacteriia bacterium]|nr:FHA domain-containing protein [Terriglobia bacterium]
MPPRIVITEATREQTVELLSPSTVLGREPGCDIQLLDLKLSRRHARLEVSPQGVKLSDLGSRNGTFLNGRQITEAWLNHGDTFQIGHVRITFLQAKGEDESTEEVPPPAAPSGRSRVTRTVTSLTEQPGGSQPAQSLPSSQPAAPAVEPMPPPPVPPLSPISLPETPPGVAEPPEPKTVFLDAHKLQEISQRPVPPAADVPPNVESTSRLPSMSPGEPKTVSMDAQKLQEVHRAAPPPPSARPVADSTARLPALPQPAERGTQILDVPPPGGRDRTVSVQAGFSGSTVLARQAPPASDEALLAPMMEHVQKKLVSRIRFPRMAWRMKFTLLLTLMLMFLLLVILLPLLRIQEKAVVRTSLERGLALTSSLAARNYFPVANNQRLQLDTDFISREEGVKQSAILDPGGQVLSPTARAGEVVTRIEGISKNTSQIRLTEEGVTTSGDYNLVLPIKNENAQIIGYAWITYTPAGLSQSGGNITVVVMLVIFLAAIGGAALVWSATNMTVQPLQRLRDETESAIRGDVDRVDSLAGFAEINALAQSINRLIERTSLPPETAAPRPQRPVQTPYDTPTPRARSLPPPSGIPAPPVSAAPAPGVSVTPSAPAILGTSEVGELLVDGNFTIMQVKGNAPKWLGMRANELVGKHVIEAVREQQLLEAILDLINALASQPQVAQEFDFSSIPSLGAPFVLDATKSGGSDQISIKLIRK